MAVILSVVTQKGGVGKTTIAGAITNTAALYGKKTLAVDFDPQANLSYSFGACQSTSTIYNAIRGEVSLSECIISTPSGDIIPSDILLNSAELDFISENREFLLKNILREVSDIYDYIIIDSPPGLGILTACALCASDYVIIPMLPDSFSLQGIVLIDDTINRVRMSCNPRLNVAGILINQYSPLNRLHREARKTAMLIASGCGMDIFSTVIHRNGALSEAHTLQTNIACYTRCRRAVKDFKNLFLEMQQKNIL